MNIGSRQIGLAYLGLLMMLGKSNAQTLLNPKMGMETWSLKDETELSGQSRHPGQMIGLDVIVMKDRWLFMPGFQYHRISMINEEHSFSFDFNDPHHAHYFIIPLQAGYTVTSDSSFQLSVLAGAAVNIFYDLDQNDLGLNAEDFYGVTTSLTAGLCAEFLSFLTAEIKYQFALQPILKPRDDSKLRGWTLALGVRF